MILVVFFVYFGS